MHRGTKYVLSEASSLYSPAGCQPFAEALFLSSFCLVSLLLWEYFDNLAKEQSMRWGAKSVSVCSPFPLVLRCEACAEAAFWGRTSLTSVQFKLNYFTKSMFSKSRFSWALSAWSPASLTTLYQSLQQQPTGLVLLNLWRGLKLLHQVHVLKIALFLSSFCLVSYTFDSLLSTKHRSSLCIGLSCPMSMLYWSWSSLVFSTFDRGVNLVHKQPSGEEPLGPLYS